MNIRNLEQRLRDKQRQLLADMTRTEAEARESRVAEVNDLPVSSETKESWFRETSSEWNVFTPVRDALQRIESGKYGKCVDCGNPIDEARLESIPWAPYCKADEERHEREAEASRMLGLI